MKRLLAVLLLLTFAVTFSAAESGTVSGAVTDSLGAVVQSATVELIENGATLQSTETGEAGTFRFTIEHAGRYLIRASARTFRPSTSKEVFLAPSRSAEVNLTLSPSAITQSIVVVATGIPTPDAQIGSSVSTIGEDDSDYPGPHKRSSYSQGSRSRRRDSAEPLLPCLFAGAGGRKQGIH